jgi:hypothetical protein
VKLAGTILVVAMLCGCEACQRGQGQDRAAQAATECAPAAESMAAGVPTARPFARGLIFDQRPGLYAASEFTYRSDWPSSDAYHAGPEIILFREHSYNIQGPGFYNNDYSYRQFDTYRVGAAVR